MSAVEQRLQNAIHTERDDMARKVAELHAKIHVDVEKVPRDLTPPPLSVLVLPSQHPMKHPLNSSTRSTYPLVQPFVIPSERPLSSTPLTTPSHHTLSPSPITITRSNRN